MCKYAKGIEGQRTYPRDISIQGGQFSFIADSETTLRLFASILLTKALISYPVCISHINKT